jgi:hypothetical protein
MKNDISRIQKILEAYQLEAPLFGEIHVLQARAYDYIRGVQFSQEALDYYRMQKRYAVAFNVMFEKFNFILGDYYLNDAKQRVYPQPGGDPSIAAIWEDILDHNHSVNDYRAEMGQTVFAGWVHMGGMTVEWCDDYEADGSVVYRNVDENEILWDSQARHRYLDDARYVIRHKWLERETILAYSGWQVNKKAIEARMEAQATNEYLHDLPDWARTAVEDGLYVDTRHNQYKVIEFHEMLWDKVDIAVHPMTGKAHVISQMDEYRLQTYLRANPGVQIISRPARVKKITTIIPALLMIVDERYADVQDGTYDILIYHPYPYGKRTIQNFGLGTLLLGPQDWLNALHNRTADAMARAANGAVDVVAEAYENSDQIRQHGLQPGFVLWRRPQFAGVDTAHYIEGNELPRGYEIMKQDALNFIEMMTVTSNTLGRSETANEAASLYAQRVAQGQIRFSVPSYVLNGVKTRLNEKMIGIGQMHYANERMFLMTDSRTMEQRKVFVNLHVGEQILNDLTVGSYKVQVDDATKNPTIALVRNALKTELAQFIQSVFGPQAAFAIDWESLLRDGNYGDPETWLEKIKQTIEMMGGSMAQQGALDTMNQMIQTAKMQADALQGEQMQQGNSNSGTPATAGPRK